VTHILRSGTYGLGSLKVCKPAPNPLGRGVLSKAERLTRIAVLRESILLLFKMTPRARTLKQIMADLPHAYEIETQKVLKTLIAEKLFTRRNHMGRVFYSQRAAKMSLESILHRQLPPRQRHPTVRPSSSSVPAAPREALR